MKALSNELRAYYRSVAEALPCAGSAKRRYLKELYNRLYDLQLEQPAANRQTACERFGTAEQIGESWLESITICDFQRQAAFSRRVKVLIVVFAVAAIIGLALLGRFYLKYRDAMLGDFIVVYEDEVEEPSGATDDELRQIEDAS